MAPKSSVRKNNKNKRLRKMYKVMEKLSQARRNKQMKLSNGEPILINGELMKTFLDVSGHKGLILHVMFTRNVKNDRDVCDISSCLNHILLFRDYDQYEYYGKHYLPYAETYTTFSSNGNMLPVPFERYKEIVLEKGALRINFFDETLLKFIAPFFEHCIMSIIEPFELWPMEWMKHFRHVYISKFPASYGGLTTMEQFQHNLVRQLQSIETLFWDNSMHYNYRADIYQENTIKNNMSTLKYFGASFPTQELKDSAGNQFISLLSPNTQINFMVQQPYKPNSYVRNDDGNVLLHYYSEEEYYRHLPKTGFLVGKGDYHEFDSDCEDERISELEDFEI